MSFRGCAHEKKSQSDEGVPNMVQHGAKLPLSNKVEGCGEKLFFWATFFVANRIEVSPYHVSFKCISSHFRGLSLRQPKLKHYSPSFDICQN